MLIASIVVLSVIVNIILHYLYRRNDDGKLLELSALTTRNLNDYCDNLEAENSRLIAENRNFALRIDELESRLRAMKRRQSLGLRAYDVGRSGVYKRYVEGIN